MRPPVMNPYEPEYGSKEYYELEYGRKRSIQTFMGKAQPITASMVKKAVAPWDPPTDPYDYYFDPAFSNDVEEYVSRDSTVYNLLKKETFQRVGDSWKYFATDISATQEVANNATPFASGSTESGPDFQTIEQIEPAWLVTPYETNYFSEITSQWQPFKNNTVAWIKDYFQRVVPNDYDALMLDDVDNARTAANRIESLDRIISNGTESGDGTTYVSAVTDGDLYYGKASLIADRSEAAYSWSDGQIDLPASAAARVLDLGMIDDVFADALDYAENNPEYAIITGPRTLNEINKLIDDKQRFPETMVQVQQTMNGISTRRGVMGGFSVMGYRSNGKDLPIFTSKHVSGENGANLTTKISDADIGHIYIVNLNDIHLRVGLPPTYMRTGPEHRLSMDSFDDRHWILSGMQLVATKFNTHAAVKYLKAA